MMIHWAVDIAGIDLESDLRREEVKNSYNVSLCRLVAHQSAEDSRPAPGAHASGPCEVMVLDPDEVLDLHEEKMANALRLIPSAPQNPLANSAAGSSSTGLASPSHSAEATKGKEIRVFCDFLNPQGKRIAVSLRVYQPAFKAVDVVGMLLQQVILPDEQLSQRYAHNPRLYKVSIADEFTGEEEMAVQLDVSASSFGCFVVSPLPAAKLFLFPQRTELLPMIYNDIHVVVNIRPLDPQGKVFQRTCVVPADMLLERLEATLVSRLPTSSIVQGSMRICYGPLELNINEYYNFGAGCGQASCPIAELTMLTLTRFGVSEVVVSSRVTEEAESVMVAEANDDFDIDMDLEEAQSFQQFEVVSINRYGARQQRLLCVDGNYLYTMRPNTSDAVPKTTERMIKDIEEVRTFAERPKYIEIEYTKASRYAEDHFECTTTYNCALLDEKLRIVRRELRKQAAEAPPPPNEGLLHYLGDGFRRAKMWFKS